MEYWNPEKLIYTNTDEFKYLDEIKKVIYLSSGINKDLINIYDHQRYLIQCGDRKYKHDFNEIR